MKNGMRTKAVLLLLLAAAAVSAAYILLRDGGADAPVARVTRDGVLLEEIDLSRVDAPYTLTFRDGSGSNTVLVEKGRVRVSAADCPDQICVHQGYISDDLIPIICLPHRLMVEIVGAGGGLDGGTG